MHLLPSKTIDVYCAQCLTNFVLTYKRGDGPKQFNTCPFCADDQYLIPAPEPEVTPSTSSPLASSTIEPTSVRLAIITPINTAVVLRAVAAERARQNKLVADGKLPWNCSDPNIPSGGKLMVLCEEFGEVAKAAYEDFSLEGPVDNTKHLEALRTELIQLAAVAVAWAESIDEVAATPAGPSTINKGQSGSH